MVYRNSKIEHNDVIMTCYKNNKPLTMVVKRLLLTIAIALFTIVHILEVKQTKPDQKIQVRNKKCKFVTIQPITQFSKFDWV